MLIRIVRMTFRPEAVGEFLTLFDASSDRIRDFEGCHHLELWQDADHDYVFTTYSLWTDAEALDSYRESDVFRSAWNAAKALFDAPAEASSHTKAREVAHANSA